MRRLITAAVFPVGSFVPMNASRSVAPLCWKLFAFSFLWGASLINGRAIEPPPPAEVVIHSEPLNTGRVSPRLFGNFIELLNDVVPGMWAEMLNDRSFEGVLPLHRNVYFDGRPDFCDRTWDANPTWSLSAEKAFNGARCARLTPTQKTPAELTQSGLAVRKGMKYQLSGYFRGSGELTNLTVSLESLLPDGLWFTLAEAKLDPPTDSWQRRSVSMISRGQTDRVRFVLKAEGEGTLWADKLSLMPDDQVHGWRRDVVDVVKDLHPAIIRWGGSLIDPGGYQWKKGIGDRDRRTPFINQAWGRIDSNDVGIDEFCQFCEAVGAEPLICVSFGDGPQGAAELVQYCNGSSSSTMGALRAANGHPAPYAVKYWQVGNEIAGDSPAYLDQIEAFATGIKRADPKALVMSSYPAQKLLVHAGYLLDFVCPHQYTRDLAGIDARLTDLSKLIDNTPGCAHLKIGVTEWNVSGGEWGLMRGRQMTLETALFNARHLNIFMRHCDKVEIATRSNMANSFCGATFETNPSGVLKRPSHFVMELYGRHARPIPLKIECSSPGPDIFACASEDKKAVTLFAVNYNAAPQKLSLKGRDLSQLEISKVEAVCDTADARQLDAMNHWETPERVKRVPLPLLDNHSVMLPAYSVVALDCQCR